MIKYLNKNEWGYINCYGYRTRNIYEANLFNSAEEADNGRDEVIRIEIIYAILDTGEPDGVRETSN